MLCPKDNVVCELKRFDYVEVHVCPKCSGVWIDQGTIKDLVTHLTIPGLSTIDEQFSAWEVEAHDGTLAKDFWQEDNLVCARHNVFLKKHYFGGSSIGVDQCPVCKIFWFDGGELQAVSDMIVDSSSSVVNTNRENDSKELKEAGKRISDSIVVFTRIASQKFPPMILIGMPIAFFVETLVNFVDLKNRMKDW